MYLRASHRIGSRTDEDTPLALLAQCRTLPAVPELTCLAEGVDHVASILARFAQAHQFSAPLLLRNASEVCLFIAGGTSIVLDFELRLSLLDLQCPS